MADPRFHTKVKSISLREISDLTGALLLNPDSGSLSVSDVAALDQATSEQLSFLDNVKYLDKFVATKAGACFVREKYASRAPKHVNLLVTENPYGCYAQVASILYPMKKDASVHTTAQIGKGVQVGKDVSIGAFTVIGDNVVIGDNSSIASNVTISHAIIGKNAIIHAGVRIGQDGFGFAPTKAGLLKVPQLGRVVIGNDVEIGANTCIDRGAGPDTEIGDGTKIDNLVQIGHNVKIGKFTVIAAQTGISGSTVIGNGVMLGGQVGAAGHITIHDGAKVAAQSGLHADIPPQAIYGGYPAVPVKDWHRQTIALSKLIKKN
jgi:UDP-3-O-[3-hydroxymyristoyl] glucosamine N-acyltransferase